MSRNLTQILNDFVNKLKDIEEKMVIINNEGDRLMNLLENTDQIIFGEEGNSPVGIEEPIINENKVHVLENRLVDVTKAALKLADMKDNILEQVYRLNDEVTRSQSLQSSRRSKRNSTARGVKKSKKHLKKYKK